MRNNSAIAREFIETSESKTCPVIDMHGHYGPYGWLYFPMPYADNMLHSMESAGVKAIVCSSHMAVFHDTARGNKIMEVLKLNDGFYTALGTPIDENGDFIKHSFVKHVEDQIEAGAS